MNSNNAENSSNIEFFSHQVSIPAVKDDAPLPARNNYALFESFSPWLCTFILAFSKYKGKTIITIR